MSSQYYVRSCVCHSSATLSIQRKAARSFSSFLDGTKRNWEQRFHIILERCLLAMYLLPLLSTNSSPQPPPRWIPLLPLFPPFRLSIRLSPSHFIRMIVPFHGDDPPLNGAYIPATLHHPLGTHIHKEDGGV